MDRNTQQQVRSKGRRCPEMCSVLTGWWERACTALMLSVTMAIALPAQTFTTLHSFDVTDGAHPYAALIQATDGNFYGTTRFGGESDQGTIFKITATGTLTTLHSFDNNTGGAYPYAGLVQDTRGMFYGAPCGAPCGGLGKGEGYGTVFSLSVDRGPKLTSGVAQ